MKTPSSTPDAILQTAFGFWNSKALLTAIDFDLFTKLSNRRLTGAQIGSELGLHSRGIFDFLDALVAMKFLDRDGEGADAKYYNTTATALYLDQQSPRYIGGILKMLNARLFKFWNDLPEALRTGEPQNETKHGRKGIFDELYAEPRTLRNGVAKQGSRVSKLSISLAQQARQSLTNKTTEKNQETQIRVRPS